MICGNVAYAFFVDMEGHVELAQVLANDGQVKLAIDTGACKSLC